MMTVELAYIKLYRKLSLEARNAIRAIRCTDKKVQRQARIEAIDIEYQYLVKEEAGYDCNCSSFTVHKCGRRWEL